MSHRVLKPEMKEPKGLFNDLSDLAEGCYYWAKNELHSLKESKVVWPERLGARKPLSCHVSQCASPSSAW